MSGAKQVPMRVDGQYIDVWIAKDWATWRAWADYRGQHIVARGGTQSDATGKWQQQASSKPRNSPAVPRRARRGCAIEWVGELLTDEERM